MAANGNILSSRGVSASAAVQQSAFRIGVEDWRRGRPFRCGHDLPPLVGISDSMANRERIYETGRLVAIYARHRHRTVNAATAIAAKRDGYISGRNP